MSTHLTVVSAEYRAPRLRRLWFHSDDLGAFAGSGYTDRYVKVVFPRPGVHYPDPLDLRALRGTMPPEDLPVVRTYTALLPDTASGTLAIDFVIHGDDGVAGPWARAAVPGDTLMVNGPGGAYAPDPTSDWHLMVGDESALPAIDAAVAALPHDAVVRVIALVDGPQDRVEITGPEGLEVSWVYRGDTVDDPLTQAVADMTWLPGRVQVFAHGEAEEIMHGVRPHLFRERCLAREQVSISGYWRRGRSEEAFRQWKSELAQRDRETSNAG